MDETMFGGKRSEKRGWGATGKSLLFLSHPVLKRPCNLILHNIPKQGASTIPITGLPMPFYLSVAITW